MSYDFLVIGATGMQGRIVTKDLLKNNYSVLMCGRDETRVGDILKRFKKTSFSHLDLKDEIKSIDIIRKSKAKVIINCAEGNWDLAVLKMCLKAKIHSIDLGSDIPMTKEQLKLHKILEKENLIHITGCGSVPGIGNVMLNHAFEKFDKIKSVSVGFAWDSNIKKFVVPFSIESIIEEFTANAPYLHNRKVKIIKPFDSIREVYHRAIGKQKEFKVGHHPETYTFYEFCKKKGIQNVEFYAGFPDHSIESILKMIGMGFGDKEPIELEGIKIKPINFLTKLLKRIKMPKNYKETENLWVLIKGEQKDKKKEILMECVVPPLKGWEDAGCNIDTGMPASIIAQMIFDGIITTPGSYSPELIVPPKEFFAELKRRSMCVYENGKVIN